MGAALARPAVRSAAGWLVLLVLVTAAGAAAVVANVWKRDLRVERVRTEGNQIVASAEILRLAAIGRDVRLFDLDLAAVEKRVRAHAFIKVAEVTRSVPDRVTIAVVERSPVAMVAGEKLMYLDADGVVLPALKSEELFDLPVITGTLPGSEITPGARVRAPEVLSALGVIAIAGRMGNEAYHRISEVHIRPDRQLVLTTAENGVSVVLGREDVGRRLVKFEGFWRDIVSRRGAQELESVDLRYEDLVVARWK